VVGNLKLVKKEHNTIVCRFGDEGEDFFIILKGRCSVWIPVSNANVVPLLNEFISKIKSVKTNVKDEFDFKYF
jgi:hypothetical protein